MERSERLEKIKEHIASKKITSQEDLLMFLLGNGIQTTQATLSRDFKYLKVSKVFDPEVGYYYALPAAENIDDFMAHYEQDICRGFLSMEFSDNICLINTLSGHANPVAAALDRLGFDEILGTVAGDDTIMAVLKEGCSRDDFTGSLNKIIKGEPFNGS